jgi:hypothetical protein
MMSVSIDVAVICGRETNLIKAKEKDKRRMNLVCTLCLQFLWKKVEDMGNLSLN